MWTEKHFRCTRIIEPPLYCRRADETWECDGRSRRGQRTLSPPFVAPHPRNLLVARRSY